MFIDKDFEELWHFDNLPERISVGDYGLFEEERETLINYIKGFFRYIREQGHVPLSDLPVIWGFSICSAKRRMKH